VIDEALLDAFAQAQELSGADREAFLVGLAGHDPAMAHELRELLRADDRETSVLERSPYGPEEIGDAELLPAQIGPYHVVREIGRGGMGRVYLAEQRGEGFVRRVAVKRLDQWRASPASARRFRDEVKFLAALEHPGIARFLDGGRAADGSAYLALEYVEGSDLLSHAREHELSVAARLRLFLEVLAAVEFAHARRIVHRDLKPGNLLVGADGRPKLLDFGISKLIDPEAGDSLTTRTDLRALTPAYASPEQIRGAAVTVASDVYSLGVVLYELLSGVHPFRSASGDARELERAVLERDPEPPSTAARRATKDDSRGPGGEPPAANAAARLGRDLDAICLKALRKEPQARYRSVTELADDLRRFLAGLPVAAHRGGVAYRLGKAARRYRVHLAVAAAAALLATLLVLVAVRGLGGVRDFGGGARGSLPAVAAPTHARPTLSRIGELSARFAENPNRAEIGLELIDALLAAGRGDDAIGAVDRLRQLPGALGKGPRIDLAEAEAAVAVSEYQRAASAAAAAEEGATRAHDPALARRARLAQGRALLRLSPPDETGRRMAALVAEAEAAGDERTAVEAMVVRALAARKGAHAEEASGLLAAALPRARALGDRRAEAQVLTLQGRLEGESGAIDKGLQTLDAALAIAVAEGDVASEAGALLIKMALLNWAGKDEAAMEVGKLAVQRLRISGDREQLLTLLGNVAMNRVDRAEFREAEAVIVEAEPLARRLGSPRHRGSILRARGYLEEQRGETAAARASYTAAIAAGREAGVDSVVALYLLNLAWVDLNDDRFDEAATAAAEAVELCRRGGDERTAIEAGAVLACVDAAHGRVASARQRLAALAKQADETDSDSAKFQLLLAQARVAEILGELPRAIELRRREVEAARGFGLPGLLLQTRSQLALVLDRAGKRDEALALAHELLPEAERLGVGGVVRDCRRILDRTPAPSG
jgi:tetratricopeptide (TPR) repeat protein/tRNA A-37 threonylcarbamoyl transferase component Bud32